MESPAERLGRLLVGIFLALLLVTAFAVLDGRISRFEMGFGAIFAIIALLSGGFALLLRAVGGGAPGSFLTDGWFSREEEQAMHIRLESEMEEASIENMGADWARMEMEHLEAKHLEEE
ncbi:MAG: hypothetical protein VYD50_03070 [Candidatus Thermoplasmatota archaeon]|nr:hypothetical protein [Candidatus Thermoplasmatota archaeon]